MSCVPCPCDLFRITNGFECLVLNDIFQDPPRLGQLYAGIYTTASYAPDIVEGIPHMLQTDITSWFLKVSLAFILPWVIMFIILFLIMGRIGLTSFDTTFMLIILVIIIAIIAFAFIYWETQGIIKNLGTQVHDQLIANWDAKKEIIVPAIRGAYQNCSYCPSTTSGCTSSCGGECAGVCPVIGSSSDNLSQTTEEMLISLESINKTDDSPIGNNLSSI